MCSSVYETGFDSSRLVKERKRAILQTRAHGAQGHMVSRAAAIVGPVSAQSPRMTLIGCWRILARAVVAPTHRARRVLQGSSTRGIL